jgi:hypothetical protein
VRSQTNTDSQATIEKKSFKWDTLKYRKYERVLIVGLFQQFRNFDNSFENNTGFLGTNASNSSL